MSRRSLMAVNAGFRMVYGVGGLLSPAAMGRLRLGADTPERPGARQRPSGDLVGGVAFSAAGIGTACAALRRPQ